MRPMTGRAYGDTSGFTWTGDRLGKEAEGKGREAPIRYVCLLHILGRATRSEERTLIHVIIATCAGLVALSTISVQAAPLPPSTSVPTELTVSPIMPAANGCGYGYRRTQWQDQWGRW